MQTVTRKVGKIDKVRALAVNETAKHFGVDPSHVRKIDAGERENDDIKKHYRDLYNKLSTILSA